MVAIKMPELRTRPTISRVYKCHEKLAAGIIIV